MGNEVMLLVVAGVFLVFMVPVFAISAFVRVRKLEARKSGSANLEGSIASLTQRVYEVENKLAALETRPAPAAARPPGVAPVPMPTPPQVSRPAAEAPVLPAALIGASADAAAPPQPPRGPSSGMERPITPAGRAGGLDFESQVAGRWLNYVGIL